MNDKRRNTNSSKRLPIVFCLDVSPSMRWKEGNNNSSIELLNVAVSDFIKQLRKHPKASIAAEVAFVTFSTNIEIDTEFEPIKFLKTPTFSTVEEGGTRMAQAVIRSIDKIEQHRQNLKNLETPYYAPFFVLVTDGNPDKNDDKDQYNKAINIIKSHCASKVGAEEIIVPFIIGVGDYIVPETLKSYSAGFIDGYFPIRGTGDSAKAKFGKVFYMIGNSVTKSFDLNRMNNTALGTDSGILQTLKNDMIDLMRDLGGE